MVLDRRSRVVAERPARGVALAAGQRSVQATGDLAPRLLRLARVGHRLRVTHRPAGPRAPPLRPGSGTSVVNGGPVLVRDGRVHVTPRRDGFVQPSPSVYYGFSHQRNPRTFAGVDAAGRTVIATVDGRSLTSLGTSIVETAQLARALGMRDAINLDGGGSTTMVTGGEVVNDPSDTTGERPVGTRCWCCRAEGRGSPGRQRGSAVADRVGAMGERCELCDLPLEQWGERDLVADPPGALTA